MTNPNMIILYVTDPQASAGFYADLLGKSPIESACTFAMFALESGVIFGLWAKHAVEPAATATGGGTELAFSVADNDAVNMLHADWVRRGLIITQAPTQMDFGFTFVACDPDGHRLRVFAQSAMR